MDSNHLLSPERIKDLNMDMLCLGAPIERDDVGYNKPDWERMEALGRYLGEYDDRMCLAVLSTLSHYKNTQLSYMATEIEESLNEYRGRVAGDASLEFGIGFVASKGIGSFKSKDVSLVGVKYEILDKHPEFKVPYIIVDCNIGDRDGANALYTTTQKAGKRTVIFFGSQYVRAGRIPKPAFEVAPTSLVPLMDTLKDFGRYGFAPDEKLQAFIDEKLPSVIEEYIAIKTKAGIKMVSVIGYEQLEMGGQVFAVVMFDGYVPEIQSLKGKYTIKSRKTVDGRWQTLLPRPAVNEALSVLAAAGYTIPDIAEVIDGIDKKVVEIEEAAANRNKSGNKLIDLSKLTLPFTPYPYQVEDAETIVATKRTLIGHDMGCGKTWIAVVVGGSIQGRKIAIVPESLRLNWQREIKQVFPDADVQISYSNKPFVAGNDWTIIGYKTAVKYADDIINTGFECSFVDEVQKCKAVNNYGKAASKTAESVLKICEHTPYCYPMTGTPLPTSNKDLFNIFRMLDAPEVITGKKYEFLNFAQKFCDAVENGFGWDCNGSSNQEELNELLSKYMVRRLKKVVLPHLQKQRVFIPVYITSRSYAKVEKDLRKKSTGMDSYMALAMKGRNIMGTEKMKAGIDLAESMVEAGRSVVLVSGFNDSIDLAVNYFGSDCCCIRGGMSDEAKEKAKLDFQNGKYHVCVLQTVAGGVGLTLTKAHDMIICDIDWTPANMTQVEDRICRTGQTEDICTIHYFYGENSTIDKLFMEMITEKSENIDKVVDNAESDVQFTGDTKRAVSFLSRLQTYLKEEKEKADAEKAAAEEKKSDEPIGSDGDSQDPEL